MINNAGFSSLACTMGRTYNFIHCTFANYWNKSLRKFPVVLVNHFYINSEGTKQIYVPKNLLTTNFSNSIIFGNSRIEFLLDKVDGASFNFNFQNNLIQLDDYYKSCTSKPDYQFFNLSFYQNNLFNLSPDFKDPRTSQLKIGKSSAGIQKASIAKTLLIPTDFLGTNRTTSPDIGAFHHINFQ